MRILFALLLLIGAVLTQGCDELEARRLIQRADALYLEGRADKAVPLYEEALAKKPDLLIGLHNAGLAYLQLFQEGVETEENLAYAKHATKYFKQYLEAEPKDNDIQKLLTKTWEDSGQVDEALAFWTEKLQADPKNREILTSLAAVNIKAERVEAGIAWLWKLAEIETENAGKVQAYLAIGRTCLGKLAKADLVDLDRLKMADEGIAALQLAGELEPKNLQIHGLLNAMYQRRALAHGASWAKILDLAAARMHWNRYRELNEELQKASKSEADKGGAKPAEKEAPEKK